MPSGPKRFRVFREMGPSLFKRWIKCFSPDKSQFNFYVLSAGTNYHELRFSHDREDSTNNVIYFLNIWGQVDEIPFIKLVKTINIVISTLLDPFNI